MIPAPRIQPHPKSLSGLKNTNMCLHSLDFLEAFLEASFDGGRHVARVEKIMALESE